MYVDQTICLFTAKEVFLHSAEIAIANVPSAFNKFLRKLGFITSSTSRAGRPATVLLMLGNAFPNGLPCSIMSFILFMMAQWEHKSDAISLALCLAFFSSAIKVRFKGNDMKPQWLHNSTEKIGRLTKGTRHQLRNEKFIKRAAFHASGQDWQHGFYLLFISPILFRARGHSCPLLWPTAMVTAWAFYISCGKCCLARLL